MRQWLLLVSVLSFGCAAESLGDKNDSKIVLTDASQRAITVIAVDNKPTKSTTPNDKGGSSHDGRRVTPHRIVCAEPSPDIAKAVSTALESSVKGKGNVGDDVTAELEGSFNRSVAESIAQLGSRVATIQLLRDELADLCRAYANGAVSSITYTLRLSRLDKKMITLLVSEASAGALSRALVGINGSASFGGTLPKEKLQEAESRITAAAKAASEAATALDAANKKLKDATEAGPREAAQKDVTKAAEALRDRLNELTDRVIEKWALDTRGSGLLAASTATAIAALPNQAVSSFDLKGIHKAYLEDDDLGTLLDACLTSMEDNPSVASAGVSAAAEELRDALNETELKMRAAEQRVRSLTPPPRLRKEGEKTPERLERSPEEQNKLNEAVKEAEALRIRYRQLALDYEEKSGAADRTGLLSFCRRQGMTSITRLIEKKIQDRFFIENLRANMEICRGALNSSNTEIHYACAKGLFREEKL